MQTRLENLTAILTQLESESVKFRLIRGEFRAIESTVPADRIEGIAICRAGLSLALRARLGMCQDCGLVQACKPISKRDAPKWCGGCYQSRIDAINGTRLIGETEPKEPTKKREDNHLVFSESEETEA